VNLGEREGAMEKVIKGASLWQRHPGLRDFCASKEISASQSERTQLNSSER